MNIIIFGPNGSGKGTQAQYLEREKGLYHIETGGMFRKHIAEKTPLGLKAKSYIEQGILVPDEVTVPMILDTLQELPANTGWLLDGFPRNLVQAEKLMEALDQQGVSVEYIVELLLQRDIAERRLIGRRICTANAGHSNNVAIPAIAPEKENICRVCGAQLNTRSDDMDVEAIKKRHDIYYDTLHGTTAGLEYCKRYVKESPNFTTRHIAIDATQDIKSVYEALAGELI